MVPVPSPRRRLCASGARRRGSKPARPEVALLLSTGGLDERGVRWNPSNSLLSRALIRLRKAGLRNMMRMAELKVRIHSPPPASLVRTRSAATMSAVSSVPSLKRRYFLAGGRRAPVWRIRVDERARVGRHITTLRLGDRRAVAVKSGSRTSDVAGRGVELSAIRQKTSPRHKVHF